MTVKAFYHSDSGTREISMTLHMATDFPDAGPATPWILDPALNMREMTITLRPEDRWPNRLRKGVPIEYKVMDHLFVGTVVRRRKNVLTCWGTFE